MGSVSVLVALVVGVIQGVLEWLPVSSEGGVALVLAALGSPPVAAVRLALFLHIGTALAAAAYYRDDLLGIAVDLLGWRPTRAFSGEMATVSFLGGATLVSGVVGIGAYLLVIDLATALAGGAFIALIGGLLVLTGITQRVAGAASLGRRDRPDWLDAVLVGVGQGLAILPGISRSGTTVSVLLLRGHDGESAFRLSFLLSIPAALGAGGLAVLGIGGLPGVDPIAALVALSASLLVGYVSIDALVRVVRRIEFWAVCAGFGGLAVVGGVLLLV